MGMVATSVIWSGVHSRRFFLIRLSTSNHCFCGMLMKHGVCVGVCGCVCVYVCINKQKISKNLERIRSNGCENRDLREKWTLEHFFSSRTGQEWRSYEVLKTEVRISNSLNCDETWLQQKQHQHKKKRSEKRLAQNGQTWPTTDNRYSVYHEWPGVTREYPPPPVYQNWFDVTPYPKTDLGIDFRSSFLSRKRCAHFQDEIFTNGKVIDDNYRRKKSCPFRL